MLGFLNAVQNGIISVLSLLGNRIVGALLVALLVGAAAYRVSVRIYEVEELEESAFRVEVSAEEEAAVTAEDAGLEPVSPLLASASVVDGESAFKRCIACHTVEKGGANRIGPNLWNVVGQTKAADETFGYSDALSGTDGEWTYEDLNEFLANPSEYAPGTKMSFAGIRKVEDRANLIAYLRENSDSPPPLPTE
ncbi:MAG: c-type cytochrome [Alphaproteobacteria bacterium]